MYIFEEVTSTSYWNCCDVTVSCNWLLGKVFAILPWDNHGGAFLEGVVYQLILQFQNKISQFRRKKIPNKCFAGEKKEKNNIFHIKLPPSTQGFFLITLYNVKISFVKGRQGSRFCM